MIALSDCSAYYLMQAYDEMLPPSNRGC